MSDRTIWTNRLIDGLKVDAITLNGGWKIDAVSIADGSVTDAEFQALNGVSSNIQAQINAIWAAPLTGETPKITTDVKFPNGIPSFDGTWILLTSGTRITYFYPTFQKVTINWELVSIVPMSGTYAAPLMTYTNGLSVNSTTGEIIMSTQRIAYETASNTFEADTNQTFKWSAIFEWQVSLPFYDHGTQSANFIFDGTNGMNQKVTLDTATAHVVNFDKVAPGTYVLFVVQTGSGTLALWTVTNSWTINATSVIWSTVFPLALSAWSHIFVVSVANVKVHVGYVWQSA